MTTLNTLQKSQAPEPTPKPEPRKRFNVIDGGLGASAAGLFRRIVGLVLLTLVLGTIGALVMQSRIVQRQHELDKWNREIELLEGVNRELKFEVAELGSPERVLDDAKRLGMIPAPSVIYLSQIDTSLSPAAIQDAALMLTGASSR